MEFSPSPYNGISISPTRKYTAPSSVTYMPLTFPMLSLSFTRLISNPSTFSFPSLTMSMNFLPHLIFTFPFVIRQMSFPSVPTISYSRPNNFIPILFMTKKGRHLIARLSQINNLQNLTVMEQKKIAQISSANILSFKSVVFILITVSSNLATIFMNVIGNHSPLYIQYFVA